MGTHQHQAIGARVRLSVLGYVPVWHPRSHDIKQRLRLRNLNDGEYVRVREDSPFA